MRDLVIVGSNTAVRNNPPLATDKEIWVFNGVGMTLPRKDVVFQMHLPYAWEESPFMDDWLRKNMTIPVYMRQVYPEFPMSRAYPFAEAFDLLRGVRHHGKPLEFFTSSIAYALALAVLQCRPRVELYGVDLAQFEYEKQIGGFAFWVGFAAGHGVDLDLHCADKIFDRPLYGAQREP